MFRIAQGVAARTARMLSLVLLAALGAALLMRCAPGYFTDVREIDAAHASGARAEITSLQRTQGSVLHLLAGQLRGWAHGDLGQSRHFEVPVAGLVRARAGVTARLLSRGIAVGWMAALSLALPLSARRGRAGEVFLAGWTAALLAVPVGVLATVSLLLDKGGAVTVLALLVGVRDFKLLYRLLRTAWQAPHLLYARAQGISFRRTARVHLFPVLARELIAIAIMSIVVALSALVPIEVVFDIPGLGQLAWTAAMNRDLPVLVAVTALLAAVVGCASLFAPQDGSVEVVECV